MSYNRSVCAASLLAALISTNAAAQARPEVPTAVAPSSDQDVSNLDDIVVTGTAAGRSQLDAPFAISTFSQSAIERAAPTSIVDLLKKVPGFSAEASGGSGGGQNLYVRGLPAGGWFYVQLQEDGLTLFDEPQESFLNIDILSGIDMMTQRVEVVRGGTSPIFANNAPGGTVNFITRHGTETPEGAVRATVGSHSLGRVDGLCLGTDHRQRSLQPGRLLSSQRRIPRAGLHCGRRRPDSRQCFDPAGVCAHRRGCQISERPHRLL